MAKNNTNLTLDFRNKKVDLFKPFLGKNFHQKDWHKFMFIFLSFKLPTVAVQSCRSKSTPRTFHVQRVRRKVLFFRTLLRKVATFQPLSIPLRLYSSHTRLKTRQNEASKAYPATPLATLRRTRALILLVSTGTGWLEMDGLNLRGWWIQ